MHIYAFNTVNVFAFLFIKYLAFLKIYPFLIQLVKFALLKYKTINRIFTFFKCRSSSNVPDCKHFKAIPYLSRGVNFL